MLCLSAHRVSYWKTIVLAGFLVSISSGLMGGAALLLPRPMFWVLFIPLSLGVIFSSAVMLGGWLALYRDHRESTGQPELFSTLINRPVKPRSWAVRQLFNALSLNCGRRLSVGDIVQVRSVAEIRRTLDADGALDGLPFMPEMLRFCGSRFRVFRWADKINDMNTKTGVRRLRDTVMLEGLRCDGSAHDGCQAECQILWKHAWLQRMPALARPSDAQLDVLPGETAAIPVGSCVGLKAKRSHLEKDGAIYFCQMTELLRATEPLSRWDVRPDLRSLFYRNVGLLAFLVAVFTRLFNYAQARRGGCAYPYYPDNDLPETPRNDLSLKPGDRIRVRSWESIARTLDKNGRNRGLRFDREMIRFSGHRFSVRGRVNNLIGEDSARMLTMKTPCITLDGATATGEFLRFCPQNEFVFFREVWLQRDDSTAEGAGQGVILCSIDKRRHETSA